MEISSSGSGNAGSSSRRAGRRSGPASSDLGAKSYESRVAERNKYLQSLYRVLKESYDEWSVTPGSVPIDAVRGIVANSRIFDWGTVLPMTESELRIHDSVCRGLGTTLDLRALNTRPLHVIGSWNYGGAMTLHVVLTHPTISTSSIQIPSWIAPNDAMKVANRNQITVRSGTSTPGEHGIDIRHAQGVGLRGRFALRTLDAEWKAHDLEPPQPTLVNMSSSALMFIVAIKGLVCVCQPGHDTLGLMSSRNSGTYSSKYQGGRVMIHAPGPGDSHLKVSATGSTTYVGKPSLVGPVFEGFKQLIVDMCNDSYIARTMVQSARVVKRFGFYIH